jgi:hypothetical protein
MNLDMTPTVLSLNTGAPFNPFSRTPQVRYNAQLKDFRISAAAIYQMQYTSPGPAGNSLEYQINGGLPELYLSLEYKKSGLLAGVSGEYQMIRPRTIGTIIQNGIPIAVKVSDKIHSYSASAYIGYNHKLLNVKAKTIYGQNLGHLLMLSGYGVTENLPNGSSTYSGLNSSASWINITYGQRYLIGLFGGYIKNFGASKPLSTVFVRGFNNIDQIVRISPSFTYNIKGLSVGLEYEMTGAFYGETISDNYSVTDTHFVHNHRIYCVVAYSFSTK